MDNEVYAVVNLAESGYVEGFSLYFTKEQAESQRTGPNIVIQKLSILGEKPDSVHSLPSESVNEQNKPEIKSLNNPQTMDKNETKKPNKKKSVSK